MKRLISLLMMTMNMLIFLNSNLLHAVDYPIISLGFNGGWGQSELSKGLSGRAFLRYSLEAYIPGFQIEIGYAASFYQALKDTVILNPDPQTDRRTIRTTVFDGYPMLTGTFHLQPFGENTTLYFGGGVQFHFLSAQQKTTDRYWDAVAEKYQETDVGELTLLDQTRPGYHLLGGLRVALGKFGSFDVEVRQTFLKVASDAWENKEAANLWGEKRWNNLSGNLGLTIYIF